MFDSWEPLPGPRRRSLGGPAPVFHLSFYGIIRGSLFPSYVELFPVSAAPSSEAELSDFMESLGRMLRAELRERGEPFVVEVELHYPTETQADLYERVLRDFKAAAAALVATAEGRLPAVEEQGEI